MRDSEPAGEDGLYAFFRENGIEWTHHTHPPLNTVAESQAPPSVTVQTRSGESGS